MVSVWPFSAGAGIQHFAEEFRGYADIGGNLFLGKGFDERWIPDAKMIVALTGRQTEIIHQSALVGDQRIFCQYPEVTFKLGDCLIELFDAGALYQHYFAVEDGIYEKRAGKIMQEAGHIRDPPVLRGKLQNMFKPVLVYRITAQATTCYKGGVFVEFSFLYKELPAFQFFDGEQTSKEFDLFTGKLNSPGDILQQDLKHWLKVRNPGMHQAFDRFLLPSILGRKAVRIPISGNQAHTSYT